MEDHIINDTSIGRFRRDIRNVWLFFAIILFFAFSISTSNGKFNDAEFQAWLWLTACFLPIIIVLYADIVFKIPLLLETNYIFSLLSFWGTAAYLLYASTKYAMIQYSLDSNSETSIADYFSSNYMNVVPFEFFLCYMIWLALFDKDFALKTQTYYKKGIVGYNDNRPTSLEKGRNYLFVVGINNYKYCRKLNNAVKDAKDIKELLISKYCFEEENVHTLLDDQATRESISEELRQFVDRVTSIDNLVIYFSGHGEYDKNMNEGFWIPFEARLGKTSDYVHNSIIKTTLDAINSRHTLLIADSCFSGSIFSGRNATDKLEKIPSRWALTAGRTEVVSDGEPNSNSPFANALIKVLRNNEKSLGIAELCTKVLEIIPADTNQTPRGEPLRIKGHEGGQFYFHLREKFDVE